MQTHYKEYEKIKDKAIIMYGGMPDEIPEDKTILLYAGEGHFSKRYRIMHNGADLTPEQCAIIADEGNLCFGFDKIGVFIEVYTD